MTNETKTKKEIKRDMLLSFIEAAKKVSKNAESLRASHETLTIAFKDGRESTRALTRALNAFRRTGIRKYN